MQLEEQARWLKISIKVALERTPKIKPLIFEEMSQV